MKELKALEQLVNELDDDKLDDQNRVIILQNINKLLLTKYVIKIDDFIVYPLRVEAYYFHKGKFEDFNTHQNDKQKSEKHVSRFGKLYLHRENHKRRRGVDICLSKGNYYLSFLVKNSRINENLKEYLLKSLFINENLKKYLNLNNDFIKQMYLEDILKSIKPDIGEADDVLSTDFEEIRDVKQEDNKVKLFHTARRGLVEESYQDELLASVIELMDHTYDLAAGRGKEWTVIKNKKFYPSDESYNFSNLLGYNISEKRIAQYEEMIKQEKS